MASTHVNEDARMKIYVNRIPDEGLREHAAYDPAGMDMDRLDIRLVEPFEVDAVIALADRELVIRADIRVPLRLTCARCLEEFASVITPGAVFSYKVHPSDVVDITDDVRQEILLSYPVRFLCREECRGLCLRCGGNLNQGPCGCSMTN